jgi:FixJ family two-component response regulator
MDYLTERERTILINLVNKEPKKVADSLGISPETVNVHLHKIRQKRLAAKKLLKETDQYKKELYPKRQGE